MVKSKSNEAKSSRYKANQIKKKDARVQKEIATRERWATDKEYLKKQADNGYEKINGKWIRTRMVENAELV